MLSNMVRAISEDGGAVICVLDSTQIVRKMERIHKTSATASAALGRLLTAVSLMGSWLKNEDDNITIRVNGKGQLGGMLAVTDNNSNVRGYVDNPLAEAPVRADGKLDVPAIIGVGGVLSVVKDIGLKEPYIGQIELVSGEIAEDITAYYAISEQTPTVCALGVLVNEDLSIAKAGGFLLQLLPGSTEEEITRLEKNIESLPSITSFFADGGEIHDLMNMAMDGFNPNILEEKSVEYRCRCSEEKTERILISLGKEELADLQQEDPNAHVECHFCDKIYKIPIQKLLDELA